ncbi:MAG: TIGR00282 family metallophosphoesterase [Deltaproteobacteria bacterium]|nr:TIGR00282 family metallophosphoesterase [Candidatus Anaeroferrophillacea bacterium]
MIRVACIGDIVGRPGRQALRELLPRLVAERGVDFVIANGENAAGGFGITGEIADDLLQCGVDVITTGNHVWDRKDIERYLPQQTRLLHPANYPVKGLGPGCAVIPVAGREKLAIGVINLAGRVFMPPLDCPFQSASRIVDELRTETAVIIVDFHAEATSEKLALARYLDGRVSGVFGTHTHVQTADERILAGGTACICDLGMTGAHDSIIGMKPEPIIAKFLTGLPHRYEVATRDARMQGVLVDIDETSGRATAIERLSLKL